MRIMLEGTSTELADFLNGKDKWNPLQNGKFNLEFKNVNIYQSQASGMAMSPFTKLDSSEHETCVMIDLHTDDKSSVTLENLDKNISSIPTISW